MRRPPLDRVAFIASAAVLIFLYGFATSALGWFPNDLLVTAWSQARAVTGRDAPAVQHFVRPAVHDFEGVRVVEEAGMQPGLTFVSSMARIDGRWLPELRLMDARGHTVHEWPVDPSAIFAGVGKDHPAHGRDPEGFTIHGTLILPDGGLIFNYGYTSLVRIDACGQVMWRTPARPHHSIATADDGTYWVPTYAGPEEERQYPGVGRPGLQNTITHLTGDGEILEVIPVLELLYSGGLRDHVPHSPQFWRPDSKDLTHLNDVEPLSEALAADFPMFEAGDLLLSLNLVDLIMVVDPETGAVRWHHAGTLLHQHDPDFMPGGWIGVYNNRFDGTLRGTMLGGTQVLAIRPETDSVEVLFPTAASDTFYSQELGKWQGLENGNLLLTEGFPGRVLEVNPAGETVWEWVQTTYDGMVPHVYEGTRYDLTPEDVAAWSCSTGGAAPR